MSSSIKRLVLATFFSLWTMTLDAAGKAETRCGWFDNPTPSNVWLHDKDGAWVISIQGGYHAKGDWPVFNVDDVSTFVHTNGGSYGYGCVCLAVTTYPAKKRIKKLKSIKINKLSACRADKTLKEPANPLLP